MVSIAPSSSMILWFKCNRNVPFPYECFASRFPIFCWQFRCGFCAEMQRVCLCMCISVIHIQKTHLVNSSNTQDWICHVCHFLKCGIMCKSHINWNQVYFFNYFSGTLYNFLFCLLLCYCLFEMERSTQTRNGLVHFCCYRLAGNYWVARGVIRLHFATIKADLIHCNNFQEAGMFIWNIH